MNIPSANLLGLDTTSIESSTVSDSAMIKSSDIWYQAIVYSITIPLFILTAAGNGVILLTIKFQARLLSSTSNYFILSLAFADFFVGIVIMPIMIVFTANRQVWNYSQMLCDSWMSLDFLCSSASFLTLSMMSIERYKMLTNSYAYIKHSSKLRIVVFICLSWLVPLLSWLPTIIVSRHITPQDSINPYDCVLQADKWLILGLCVFVYHIPLICMVTFYTKLIVYIKNSSSTNLESSSSSPPHQPLSSSQQRQIDTATPVKEPNTQIKQQNKVENPNYNNSNGETDNKSGRNNSLANYYENEINRKAVAAAAETTAPTKSAVLQRHYSLQINRTYNIRNRRSSMLKRPLRTNQSFYLNNNTTVFYNNTFTRNNNNNNTTLNNATRKRAKSSEWLNKLKVVLPCCFDESKQQDLVTFNQSRLLINNLNRTTNSSLQKRDNAAKLGAVISRPIIKPSAKMNFQDIIESNNNNTDKDKDNRDPSYERCHFTIHSKSQANNQSSSASKNDDEKAADQNAENVVTAMTNMTKRKSTINRLVNNNNNKNSSDSTSTNENNVRQGSTTTSMKKKDSAHMKLYESSNYQNLRLKRNRKAARMLGILVAAFSICWLPFTIYYPLSQFYPNLLPHGATIVIWWMGYLNSTINPFLYVYSNKNIRRSVRILFCQRLWNSCRGRHVNKNFRSDSLRNNVAIYAAANGFSATNIYKRTSHRHLKLNNMPNY